MSSNDTAIRQLQLVTQYLSLAIGFPILSLGIISNILNILIFLTLSNYKTNVCSFYMLAKACFDLSTLIFGLTGHIIIQGFRDSSLTSKNWCRLRIPLLYIRSLSSYTCLCLQSIDALLCSSRHARLRQQSTIRRAHFLIIGFLFLWICNESPYYFMEQAPIIPNWRCQTTNTIYAQYRSYFTILTLSVILPLFIVSLFGYLSYRNLYKSSLHNRRIISNLNKQMIRMTLFAIFTIVIFQIPYTFAQIYFTSTANLLKDTYRQTQEQLINVFFFIYTYNTNASSFYSYCLASKQFRQQVLYVFRRLSNKRNRNQIMPLTIARRTQTNQQ